MGDIKVGQVMGLVQWKGGKKWVMADERREKDVRRGMRKMREWCPLEHESPLSSHPIPIHTETHTHFTQQEKEKEKDEWKNDLGINSSFVSLYLSPCSLSSLVSLCLSLSSPVFSCRFKNSLLMANFFLWILFSMRSSVGSTCECFSSIFMFKVKRKSI